MPDRKTGPAKRGKPGRGGGRGGNRGANRNVGNRNQVNRNQGGNRGRVQKRFPQSQNNNSQSQQAAKKRLLQAKKTLQLAIQVNNHYCYENLISKISTFSPIF